MLQYIKGPATQVPLVGALWVLWRRAPTPFYLLIVSAVLSGYLNFPPRALQSLGSLIRRAPLELNWFIKKHLRGIPRAFNFDLVAPNLIVGRMPRSVDDLKLLKNKHGVKAVITLAEDWEMMFNADSMMDAGIDRWHVASVPDFAAPTPLELGDCVEKAQLWRKDGTVYVHCNGGRGRSAAVAVSCVIVDLCASLKIPVKRYLGPAVVREIASYPLDAPKDLDAESVDGSAVALTAIHMVKAKRKIADWLGWKGSVGQYRCVVNFGVRAVAGGA